MNIESPFRSTIRSAFRLVVLLLLAASVVGCREGLLEETGERMESDQTLVHRTFAVGLDGATKAQLGSDCRVLWSLGDTFNVYDPVTGGGRSFTVTKLSSDNTRAVIEGDISAGVSILSVVYPYSAVSYWDASGNWVLAGPDAAQALGSAESVSGAALICGVSGADPSQTAQMQGLVSLVKFDVDESGISRIDVRLNGEKGGSFVDYSLTGSFASGNSYYLCVAPGTYAGGAKVVFTHSNGSTTGKASTESLALGAGKIKSFGAVSTAPAVVPYALAQAETTYGISGFVTMVQSVFGDFGEYESLVNQAISEELNSEQRSRVVNSYIFQWTSDGMTLSGRVYVPQPAFGGAALDALLLYNHLETGKNSDCPSNHQMAESIAAWLGKGYVVFCPDYYGLGASSYVSGQAVVDSPLTAEGNIDGLIALSQMLSDLSVNTGGKIYNGGYSEGGLMAMANLRYVAEHPSLGITFQKTFAGGAPYSFSTCYDAYVTKTKRLLLPDYYKYEAGTPYFLWALANLNETQYLRLNYGNMFKGNMLSNYSSYILGKNRDIANCVKFSDGKDLNIENHLTSGMLDKSSTEAQTILSVANSYDLTSGWSVPSGSEVYLYHDEDDDTVPYANYTKMKNFLGKGSNMHYFSALSLSRTMSYYAVYNTVVSASRLSGDLLDHMIAGAPFALWVYEQMN